MESYSPEEKKAILEFLDRCKQFVESGDITHCKDMTNQHHLEFSVTRKKNDYVG